MASDQEELDEEYEAIEIEDVIEISPEIQGAVYVESSPLIIGNYNENLVHNLENYLLDSDLEDDVCKIQKACIEYEDFSLVDSDSDRSEFEMLEHIEGIEKLTENLDVISVSSNWSDASKKLRDVESSEELTSDDGEDEKLDEKSDIYVRTDDLSSPCGEIPKEFEDQQDEENLGLKSTRDKQCSHSRHQQQQKMMPNVNVTSHSKSKSKRQKRRAKERRLLMEMGENSILKQISGILEEAGTCRFQELGDGKQERDLQKEVPSLTFLCIKILKSSTTKDKFQKLGLCVNKNLPTGLKDVITISNEEHSMKRLSEHWMAYVLNYFERAQQFKSSMEELPKKDADGFLFSDILFSRNVWNLLPFHWNDKYSYNYSCRHYNNNPCHRWTMNFYEKVESHPEGNSMRSATLHFTYWMMYSTLDNLRHCTPFPTSMILNFIKAVLASYINLTMPALRERNRQQTTLSSSAGSLQDGMKKLVAKMRDELTRRFPGVITNFFDEVIPYVHWARGDLSSAAMAFRDIVLDNEKGISAFMKMRCLTEMGRMYAQFGWTSSARHCFMESCDLSWTNHNLGIDEVKGQMLMMIANLYDQGLMTAEKFNLSKKAWAAVLSDHYSFKGKAALASADALLCLHCGKYEDAGVDWLCEVKERLLSIVKQDVHVAYHLSFVCACLGHRKESDEHYGQFINSFEEKSQAPGMKIVEMFMTRKTQKHDEEALTLTTENPFEPLISQTTKVKVEPIQVIWRTQLHPCRFSDNSTSYVADLCSRDPHLRISEEGLLTGNLQLQLPPIKSLNLNPYTGDIVLGKPGDVGIWKSTKDFDWSEEQRFFSTVTPMEVFNDPHSGIKVHLIMPREPTKWVHTDYGYYSYNTGSSLKSAKSKVGWKRPPSLVKLYWTGPNGEKAKLNLMSKLKDTVYQKCKQILETTYKESEYLELAMSLLESCYKNDQIMDAKDIINVTNMLVKKEYTDNVFRKKKHKDIPKRNELKYSPKSFTVRLRKRPLCYGSCLLLIVTFEDHYVTPFIVFVNCASRDTFVNPRIEEFELSKMLDGEPRNITGNRIQRAEVFCWKNHLDSLTMRDVNGEQVSEEKISRAAIKSYVITGRTLVTLLEKQDIVYYQDGRYYHTCEFLEVESIDLLGQILVVRNMYGVKFADTTLFPSMKPMRIMPCNGETGKLLGLEVSQNQEQINVSFTEHFAVLGNEKVKKNGLEFERSALALSNYLVILGLDLSSQADNTLHISSLLELPGFATDICFIHEQVGFVVAWTQDPGRLSPFPDREWLYHFDYSGNLLGTLPFLGPGPRSFCRVFLKGDKSVQEKHRGFGKPGWYLYLQDGCDGIMGVRLKTKATDNRH